MLDSHLALVDFCVVRWGRQTIMLHPKSRLFAGIDELNTVALVFEGVRECEIRPAAVLALLFCGRRSLQLIRADV